MNKFIKVYISEEMKKDFKECCDLSEYEGKAKDCSKCSCNGGSNWCLMNQQIYEEIESSDIRKIATHYGYDKQSRQCMEECGELIQAINKFWRNYFQYGEITSIDFYDMVDNKEYENLVEEIAEIEIVLAQLKMLLKCGTEVLEIADQKVQRELERIKGL